MLALVEAALAEVDAIIVERKNYVTRSQPCHDASTTPSFSYNVLSYVALSDVHSTFADLKPPL